MAEQRVYQLKQIVWAKIDNYPWWPGKVTGTVNQNRKKIYKINFFADPTYCHLFPEALSPFTQQPPSYVNFRPTDLKLRKAIQMAKKKNIEIKEKHLQQHDEDASPVEKIMHQPSAFQQTKLQSKHQIELTQKMLDNEPRFQRQNELIPIGQLLQAEVNETNIIQTLNSQMVSRLTKQKGYSERKTAFSFIEKLKGTLLTKYKLNDIESYYKKIYSQSTHPIVHINSKSFEQKRQQKGGQQLPNSHRIHRLHRFKKLGKSSKLNSVSPRVLCVKKIYSLLKRRNWQTMEAKQVSIRLFQRLCQISNQKIVFNSCKQHKQAALSNKFKQSFINLLNWLKNSDQRIQEESSCNLQQAYFYLQMSVNCDDMKRDDEQKSKATTISEKGQ